MTRAKGAGLPANPQRERFGANVRMVRFARGYSQDGLAELAGIHRTQISHIERGERQVLMETLAKLAGALEVGADLLLEGINWQPRAGRFVVVDPPELPRYRPPKPGPG